MNILRSAKYLTYVLSVISLAIVALLIEGCSSSNYESSDDYGSDAGTWGEGYDHILNDSDPDPWDGYGYDSDYVSEDEGYIDKINGEWVFIH